MVWWHEELMSLHGGAILTLRVKNQSIRGRCWLSRGRRHWAVWDGAFGRISKGINKENDDHGKLQMGQIEWDIIVEQRTDIQKNNLMWILWLRFQWILALSWAAWLVLFFSLAFYEILPLSARAGGTNKKGCPHSSIFLSKTFQDNSHTWTSTRLQTHLKQGTSRKSSTFSSPLLHNNSSWLQPLVSTHHAKLPTKLLLTASP